MKKNQFKSLLVITILIFTIFNSFIVLSSDQVHAL